MAEQIERSLWIVCFGVLMTFAVPWFMWGDGTVVAGLPVWVWWHVGWMALASLAFWFFGRRAWGLGITDEYGGESA